MSQRRSARTRLLFCTTGILLRRLMGDPELAGVSHVIVDEGTFGMKMYQENTTFVIQLC